MYWRISSFPELQHLTPRELDDLLRDDMPDCQSWRLLLACVIRGWFSGFLFLLALVAALLYFFAADVSSFAPIVLTAFWISWTIGRYQWHLLRIRRQMRQYLRRRAAEGQPSPVCLHCGYAIFNDRAASCPECGATT